MANRRDSYIMAGIAVGIAAGFYFLLFAPQQRKLSALRASIRTIEGQLVRQGVEVAGLPEIETNLKQANELLADYRTRIPAAADVGNIVEQVSAIAERLVLRNRNIEPMEPQKRGPVTALPIRISFEGAFSAAFNFLREVERLPRVARVTELIVEFNEPDDERPVGDLADGLRTELTLEVFYEAI